MKTRKNRHRVSRDYEVDEVGESLKDGAMNTAVHDRVDQRRLGEPDEELVDRVVELRSKDRRAGLRTSAAHCQDPVPREDGR
jgi:hypothetical protein